MEEPRGCWVTYRIPNEEFDTTLYVKFTLEARKDFVIDLQRELEGIVARKLSLKRQWFESLPTTPHPASFSWPHDTPRTNQTLFFRSTIQALGAKQG